MRTVLVTGGTGFIGRRMGATLSGRGYRTILVGRRLAPDVDAACDGAAVEPVQCDLRDDAAVAALMQRERPTDLLHLAWYTEHGRFWTAPENLDWVGISLRLLRAFTGQGGRRAVLAGTCAEYQWDGEPLNERSTPLKPTSLYGACKDALRRMALAWCRQAGTSCAWARIFDPFGPGENPGRLLPSVIGATLEQRPVYCTHGRQRRDRLYVDDVADALATLLESELEDAVNIGSGEALSVRRLVQMVVREAGGDPGAVQFGALPVRPDEPAVLVADPVRLRDELGWTPQWDLAAAIRQTVAWWHRRLGSNTIGERDV